jgi:beta-galactosidase
MLEDPVRGELPLTMEDLAQNFGFVLYRTVLQDPAAGLLQIEGLRDFATVLVDGCRVAHLDRRRNELSTRLDARAGALLEILVENCGRINYGRDFASDRKGIAGRVTMGRLDVLRFSADGASAPCFYKGTFHVAAPADTFLDVRDLGKGVLWVNGRNLGRFWNIGPQRSLYVPGPWLREGPNDVVAFDVFERSSRPRLSGVTAPIFNR